MIDTLQGILKSFNRFNRLKFLGQSAILNRLPVAVWRYPNRKEKHAIVDFSGQAENVELDLSALPPGFVFLPFTGRAGAPSLLIKSDLYLNNGILTMDSSNGLNDSQTQDNKFRLQSTLIKLIHSNSNGEHLDKFKWYDRDSSLPVIKATREEDFCHWVEKVIAEIKQGQIQKVVLSRTSEVPISEEFSPFDMFQHLCLAYPNAFVSLVALPGYGTWIGATPELLLSLNDHELTTVALAGTQAVNAAQKPISSVWGEKEIVEQEIVSEYIRDCFRQDNIRDFSEEEPETVRIGNILHLQTKFIWRHSLNDEMPLVNHFLGSLHPTPAVCGVPKETALKFIEEHEPHQREFYAGFLGPVNMQNQSHLFANLRCLQLQRHSAILYAGGGITRESVPRQEWLETELKLQALLKYIDGQPESKKSGVVASPKSFEGALG